VTVSIGWTGGSSHLAAAIPEALLLRTRKSAALAEPRDNSWDFMRTLCNPSSGCFFFFVASHGRTKARTVGNSSDWSKGSVWFREKLKDPQNAIRITDVQSIYETRTFRFRRLSLIAKSRWITSNQIIREEYTRSKCPNAARNDRILDRIYFKLDSVIAFVALIMTRRSSISRIWMKHCWIN